MDDTALHFFTHPTHVYHRQYEAVRAVVVDHKPQKQVAEEFGFAYRSLRQLLYEFRRGLDAPRPSTSSPFFKPSDGTGRL